MARASISIRTNPRLSASQLADFLASNSSIAQKGILRNAKYPSDARPLIIQYQKAKQTIAAALIRPESQSRICAEGIATLQQRIDDPATRPLSRDDAIRSIAVIETFQRTVNTLSLGDYRFSAPIIPTASLEINGVEVSVAPDAIVFSRNRGQDRIGNLFIRCNRGDASDASENRRREASSHLATIGFIHARNHLTGHGVPHSPTSLVIDIARERVTQGPSSTIQRIRQIETACEMIAQWWDVI